MVSLLYGKCVMLVRIASFVLHLHVVHPADDVQHLLEDPLQRQVLVQAPATSLQQLLQVVPEAQDVVFPRVDPLGVVVALRLQLPRDGHQGLDALLVRCDVRLDGVVLLLGRLHGRQVVTKVVLRRSEGRERFKYSLEILYFRI